MRRLSIIDLEGGISQSSTKRAQLAFVLNGEIYNFQRLAKELEGLGYSFRTRSDTEVILRLTRNGAPIVCRGSKVCLRWRFGRERQS